MWRSGLQPRASRAVRPRPAQLSDRQLSDPPGACEPGVMTKAVQDRMVEVARIRDSFHAALYSAPDLGAALKLAATGCAVVNVPSGSGAAGQDLRRYLAEGVLPYLPA